MSKMDYEKYVTLLAFYHVILAYVKYISAKCICMLLEM